MPNDTTVHVTREQLNELVAKATGFDGRNLIERDFLGNPMPDRKAPDYTTDIAAAWQLIATKRGDIYSKCVGVELCGITGRHFYGYYWQDISCGWRRSRIEAPTAPLAICLAYLQSKTGVRYELTELEATTTPT